MSINPAYWSLAVEIQLYLLYPVLWEIRRILGMRKSLGVLLLIGLLSRTLLAFSYTDWSFQSHQPHLWFHPLIFWFDWGLGALLAESYHSGDKLFKGHSLWGWWGLFVVSTFFKPTMMFAYLIATVASAIWIERLLWKEARLKGRVYRALVALGWVSYSCYLWHQPLIGKMTYWLKTHLQLHQPVGLFLILSLFLIPVFIWSKLSYWLFEKNGVRLGKYLWNKWSCSKLSDHGS
jgi:peptidoglycan/LPS O-acetylase OafA/YrhL